MKTLVIDIGGSSVKLWMGSEKRTEKFDSGKSLTPEQFLRQVRDIIGSETFDRVSLGYPGHVTNGRPSNDAYNLGPGWIGFDYSSAFDSPLRIMNDACMQALGSYEGGSMLYIGLGTAMGTAFIQNGAIIPLALGHLKFIKGETFDHYLSRTGLKLHGLKRWRRAVLEAAQPLKAAFLAEYIVFGGGNAKKLGELPEGYRRGGNHNAYLGGLRMWNEVCYVENLRFSDVREGSWPGEPSRAERGDRNGAS